MLIDELCKQNKTLSLNTPRICVICWTNNVFFKSYQIALRFKSLVALKQNSQLDFWKLKKLLCQSLFSAFRSIQVLGRHFGLGHGKTILSAFCLLMTFKMKRHMIGVHTNRKFKQNHAKPPTQSKSTLDYPNYMCRMAFYNSESFKRKGGGDFNGHPV